jgi:creatinine amidohydrolase/Fe(II)-dependent formamide hydrolase-like protein
VVALEEGADFALRLVNSHGGAEAELRALAAEKRAHAQVIRRMIADSR